MNRFASLLACAAGITLAGCTVTQRNVDGAKSPCCRTLVSVGPVSENSWSEASSIWETDAAQRMQWADLQGRPQIVALFYSSCHVACPITVEKLKQIESTLSKDLQAQVGIVLVTFDPMADTADVLHSFRRSQQLSNRWTLLRGTDASTRGLTGWLGVAFERQRFRLTHSNAITLLDAHGRIVFQRTGLHDPIDDFMKAVASITATPSTAAP